VCIGFYPRLGLTDCGAIDGFAAELIDGSRPR
jgi:hypothetical protein